LSFQDSVCLFCALPGRYTNFNWSSLSFSPSSVLATTPDTKVITPPNTLYHRYEILVKPATHATTTNPIAKPINAPFGPALLLSIPNRKRPTSAPPKKLIIVIDASRILPNSPPRQ